MKTYSVLIVSHPNEYPGDSPSEEVLLTNAVNYTSEGFPDLCAIRALFPKRKYMALTVWEVRKDVSRTPVRTELIFVENLYDY